MTNSLYTSLATSKLIAEKMPSFETESDEHNYCLGHTWYNDNPDGEFEKCDETEPVLSSDHYCESAMLVSENVLSALTTHDCLRFIEEWGKNKKCSGCNVVEGFHEYNCPVNDAFATSVLQHRFLDALLSDNLDLSEKHMDAFFSELLGKE